MIDPGVVSGFAGAVAKSSLVNTLRDGVVNFLADKAKDIAGDEVSKRIESLRSDAKLNKKIQKALERAAQRWAEDSPDDELISAIAKSTAFVDLPSVNKAVREIAQNPFTKSTAETLQSEFADVLPERFEEERIERNVNEFLNILREEFVAIHALQSTIQTFSSLNTANATAVLPDIEKRLEQLLEGPSATENTLQNYLTWVIDQHRYLDPKGTMQTTRQVQVLLEEVYVSLEAEVEEPLSSIDRKLYEEELKAIETREDLRPEEREDFLENLQAKFIKEEERKAPSKPIELSDLARKHEKMVILGDPGVGKTTLLRYLALRHAQAKRQSISETEELGKVLLPVYLRIAEYAENENGQALEDFLIANARGREHRDKSLPNLIYSFLNNGDCIVLLDGLDEVIEPNQRAFISSQINSLIRIYDPKGNRFVVTSRVAGYRTSPLDGSIPHYRARDMNLEQIKRFLDRWCNAVERFQTPALAPETQSANAQKEIDSITDAIETNSGVRQLAASPLLLRTLALIHKTGARIPQRRIEVYRLAADSLIRNWELSRGIPERALAREADANRLLAELAAWMHENKPAGLATEGDIKQKLCECIAPLRGKDVDHPDLESEAADFLQKIRHHTGLFVERAPRRFGFMHVTFEEYFAGRWLVAKPREAAKRIRNKLHRPRWEEPILLAIGFYGMEFPDDVSELVEEAILGKDLGGPSPYEEVLFRDLLFAVRATGDQDVDVRLRNVLADQFITLWMDKEGKGKYETLQTRAEMIMKKVQESLIGQRMAIALITALQDENADVRASAADGLSNATRSPEVVTALLQALKDENAQVRVMAAHALSNATHSPEVVAALLQALKDENADMRARTSFFFALGHSTHLPEVVTVLLQALKDENRRLWAMAINVFDDATFSVESVNALLPALQDEKANLRAKVAFALGHATLTPEAVNALLAALKDENTDVRAKATFALEKAFRNGTLTPEAVNAITPEAVNTFLEEHKVQNAALQDLAARLKDINALSAEAVNALLQRLKDENADVRAKAAYALNKATHLPEVVTALLQALQDENADVRAKAADALNKATHLPEVVTALLQAFQDVNADVRAEAAYTLNKATHLPEVVTALLQVLQDENAHVRARATYSLGNATHLPEVITALLQALKDENADVRASAASAFALRNATLSVEAVSAFLAALQDENANVRGRAILAIREIARRFSTKTFPDLPNQLASALRYPGLDGRLNDYPNPNERKGYNLIFDSLNTLAPFPTA